MKTLKLRKELIVIAAGVGLLTAGAAFAYWQYLQRQWCVQFASNGGQEVTYSRGCYNPERYKKWTVTAMAGEEGMRDEG